MRIDKTKIYIICGYVCMCQNGCLIAICVCVFILSFYLILFQFLHSISFVILHVHILYSLHLKHTTNNKKKTHTRYIFFLPLLRLSKCNPTNDGDDDDGRTKTYQQRKKKLYIYLPLYCVRHCQCINGMQWCWPSKILQQILFFFHLKLQLHSLQRITSWINEWKKFNIKNRKQQQNLRVCVRFFPLRRHLSFKLNIEPMYSYRIKSATHQTQNTQRKQRRAAFKQYSTVQQQQQQRQCRWKNEREKN